jgi:hypothetical protein
MKKLFLIVSFIIAITACKHENAQSDKVEHVTEAKLIAPPVANEYAPVGNADVKLTTAEADVAGTNAPVGDTSKKIIKEGSIEFETNDLNATRKKILSALKSYNGYVDEDNQTTNGDEDQKQYELKIRIPAKKFDPFLDAVSSTAYKIDSKNISITDATTRYIDTKTRLDNKKILEKRYLELLSKSSKISDLLEIENKLTEIRSDIESTQGQLNYLNKQVAYSSLDITFYTKQTAQVDSGQGAGYKFKTAVATGWQTLQNLFFGLIGLWPIIIILGFFYWLIKRWRKRRRAKKSY